MSLSKVILVSSLAAAAVFVSAPARSAAVECGKAHKGPDAAICQHHDLRQLDVEMNALWFAYSRVPFLMGASGARQDEENEFQHKREACGVNAACLRRVYRARIDQLKVNIAQAMENVRREENAGPPAFPAVLPAPVEGIVSRYNEQCRALGGTLTGPTRPDMLAADLDRDGRADYVLNPQNLKCSAGATSFCGNGGCEIKIAFSADDYKQPVAVLGGQPTLVQTPEGTRVEVWVNRTNCNTDRKDQACWEVLSYKDGKLERSFQTRRAD